MIGPENSRHFLNQSDSKLKSIAPWSHAFSRASGRSLVLTLSFYWFLAIFSFILIGCCDNISFKFDDFESKSARSRAWSCDNSLSELTNIKGTKIDQKRNVDGLKRAKINSNNIRRVFKMLAKFF